MLTTIQITRVSVSRYRVIFLALRKDTIRILPRMLSNTRDIYCAHGLSECLGTIGMAFETFTTSPEVRERMSVCSRVGIRVFVCSWVHVFVCLWACV